MRFSQSIAKYGAQAVMEYRAMAGLQQDNEVHETFLGSWIGRGLHEDHGVNVRVEQYYQVMAAELGMQVNAALISLTGGWRADIAVYEDLRPTAIIELKISTASMPRAR